MSEEHPIIITDDEPRVIPNSDFLHAKPMQMVEATPPVPINQYEKDMLKGTMDTETLLEMEKEEKNKKLSEEEELIVYRKEYITKVKVIGMHRIGKHPLYNGSLLKASDKQRLKVQMEKVMMLTDEQIQREFNDICIDNLFDEKTDYSTYPVYDPLAFNYKQKTTTTEDSELNRSYN